MRRAGGRRHRDPPPTTLRELACLEYGMLPDKVLGQGDYGSVWSLKSASNPTSSDWILKVSDIADAERKESFDREVYFLQRLQGTGLVPELKMAKACGGQGIQILKRYDGSFQQLGTEQGQMWNLGPRQVALTQEQIDSVVDLVLRFDVLKIMHGDLKRANILQSNNGKQVVLADFGFSGARDSPYYGLIGFTRSYGCNADVVTVDGTTRLKEPIPRALAPFMNRWQIYTDFVGGRETFVITSGKRPSLRKLNPQKLARALQLPGHILAQFRTYCTDAP